MQINQVAFLAASSKASSKALLNPLPKLLFMEFSQSPLEPQSSDDSSSTSKISSALNNISPLRLKIIVFGLWLSLFVSALEVTIVSTALFKIADDLSALNQSQWVIAAYLVTYNAFLLIVSKLSDIFSPKSVFITANVMFFAFSVACGSARTMKQLIVFRAFQGIAGSALFSLVFIVVVKMMTTENVGLYSGILSSVFAVANLLGPVLGGVITDNSSWRWIFYLNGPICAISLLILAIAMPKFNSPPLDKKTLGRLDVIGGILSIVWPIPVVLALQEGGSSYPWKSTVIIATFISGAVAAIFFLVWEIRLNASRKKDPLFPVRIFAEPVISLVFLSILLMGFSFYPAILLIPQRLQATNGASPASAGIQLLCMTLIGPLFAILAGALMPKRKPPAEYIVLFSTILIAIGMGLMSTLDTHFQTPKAIYGFELILGAGLGLVLPASYFILKTYVRPEDEAVATGITNMARTMGGCIGVSICSAVSHNSLDNDLTTLLTPSQIISLRSSLSTLSTLRDASIVREIFGEAYNRQFRVLIFFALSNVLVAMALILAVHRKKGTLKREEEGRKRKTWNPSQVPSLEVARRRRIETER